MVVSPGTGGALGGLVLPVNVIVYAVMTPLGMAGGSHARIAELAPDGTPFRLSGADGTVRQVDRMGEGATPPCYLAMYADKQCAACYYGQYLQKLLLTRQHGMCCPSLFLPSFLN